LSAGSGFVRVGNVLAQVVDGDSGAKSIDGGGGANRVGYFFAGYKTSGSALAKAGALGDGAQGTAFGEGNKQCPQHDAPDSCGSDCCELGLPEDFVGIGIAWHDIIFYHKEADTCRA
jgi:hypothetical protein